MIQRGCAFLRKKGSAWHRIYDMSLQQLIHLYQSLEPSDQQEVIHFIEFLKQKEKQLHIIKRERKAGTMLGLIQYMADDFNAPLDELKPYM